MIREIIFDMDGTIVNSEAINLKSINVAMDKFDLPPVLEKDYELAFSMKGEEALAYLGVPKEILREVRDTWFLEARKIRHESGIFPGLLEVIEGLHQQGYKMGIITSRHSRDLDFDVKRLDLGKYFKTLVASDQVENPKPSRDSMDLYLEESGANLEEIFFIGDSPHDSDFAKNCGIPFGLALWGANDKDIRADIKFSQPSEILDYLGELKNK